MRKKENMSTVKRHDETALKDKKILIAGAGISGAAAAELLVKAGCRPAIYDGNANLDREAFSAKVPTDTPLPFLLGEYDETWADDFDMLVLSPGISVHSPVAASFYDREKTVWGEIELAYYFARGRIAAITGTNGKTTTTALVGEILKTYYDDVHVVGNIGIPYTSEALRTGDGSVTAAEISSFQLETTVDFHPDVSAILNLTPDHADRHATMKIYGETKLSISKKQTKDDVILLNYDDAATRAMAEHTPATPVFFSRKAELKRGIVLSDDTFVIRDEKEYPICTTEEIKLLGSHNQENVLAAIGIGYFMGVPAPDIRRAVLSFEAVEHRIEFVETVDGVDYYNDSKGTNPDAAIKGIAAMVKPTVLIGGGYDKKAKYDAWIEAFDGKVTCLILIGATAKAIGAAAKAHGFPSVRYADTLEEAVKTARQLARPGDAVLLSPACASWDMFKNYEVRGQVFKDIVRGFMGKD